MDTAAVFTAFLQRLNLNQARQRTAITTNLASTFNELCDMTEKDVDTFISNNNTRNRTVAASPPFYRRYQINY